MINSFLFFCDSSAYSCYVKRGKTAVTTALSIEVCQIKPAQPVGISGGYIIPNIEVYSIATSEQQPGRVPLESTQTINSTVAKILNASPKLFPHNSLKIGDDKDHAKWTYVMFIDVMVLCDDGCLLDTVLFSISKLLSNDGKPITFPDMKYDKLRAELYRTGENREMQVEFSSLPISVSFSVFSSDEGKSVLFLDPDNREVKLSDENLLTIVGTSSRFISVEQQGSRLPEKLKQEAMFLSQKHFKDLSQYMK